MNYRYGLLLSAMLVALLLVGSASAGAPDVPSPPYIAKSPEEDIVKVEAWIEPVNQLRLKVTFAAPTPPTGQSILIICTILQGSTETVENWWIYSNPPNSPKTTWGNLGSGLTDPNTPIAVYAILGTLSTDRAPNSGFYQVTATSESAPNVFIDVDPGPNPVGGVVVPTNTLAILTPYLALAGLIVAVSAVVAVKKRRD